MTMLTGKSNETDLLKIPSDSVHRKHALNKLNNFTVSRLRNISINNKIRIKLSKQTIISISNNASLDDSDAALENV